MTSVAYDATGTGYRGTSANPTYTHVVGGSANGLLCAVTWNTTFQTAPTAVKVGTTSLTQLGSNLNFEASNYMSLWGISPAQGTLPTGSQTITVTIASASSGEGCCVNSVSYTGVASFGTPVTANGAEFSGNATVTVSSASGNMAFNAIADEASGGAIGSYTQTSRSNPGASSSSCCLLVGDAAGASSVTFTGSPSNYGWGTFAVNIVAGGGTITDHANQTLTFATSITDKVHFTETANQTLTLTTSVVGPSGPWDKLLSHIYGNENAYLCTVGDSTVIGDVSDTAIGGWPGRIGIILGQHYNYNVVLWTGGWTGSAFEYTTSTTLFSAVGTRPTLTIYNGGVGATGIFTNDQAYLSAGGSGLNAYIPTDPLPDVIMIGTGINDMDLDGRTASEFTSDMQTFVGDMQSTYAVGVPIIITDENVSSVDAGYATIQPGYNAVFTAYGVGDPPLTPILQLSNVSNVWMLDTQYYFGYVWNTNLMSDGYHPLPVGYQVEAVGDVGTLAPGVLQNFTDAANLTITIATSLTDTLHFTQHANQTLTISSTVNTVRHITDHANQTLTFGHTESGVRHATDHANQTLTFGNTTSGKTHFTETANQTLTITSFVSDHAVYLDHANQTLTIATSITDKVHFTETADQTLTFGHTVTGVHHITDHANQTLTFGHTVSGTHAARGTANQTLTITSFVSDHAVNFDHANQTLTFSTNVVLTPKVELGYITLEGEYLDVENPPTSGSSTQPTLNTVSGFVTFYPRIPVGTVLYIDGFDLAQAGGSGIVTAAVALAPIQARILSGVLQTINRAGTPNIQLVANTNAISEALIAQGINTAGDLWYDVQYSYIVYSAAAEQVQNFSFLAPTSASTLSLTDGSLTKYPYAGPR